jgi:hypothetical protein
MTQKKIIAVTLSGNDKPYFYTADEKQLVNRNVGDRVVVPNKLKEGGELSLSIGTYQGINPTTADSSGLKPVVQFLDAEAVLAAKVDMVRLESVKP